MLQVLDVEDDMIYSQDVIFSTLGLRNFYNIVRSRLLGRIIES